MLILITEGEQISFCRLSSSYSGDQERRLSGAWSNSGFQGLGSTEQFSTGKKKLSMWIHLLLQHQFLHCPAAGTGCCSSAVSLVEPGMNAYPCVPVFLSCECTAAELDWEKPGFNNFRKQGIKNGLLWAGNTQICVQTSLAMRDPCFRIERTLLYLVRKRDWKWSVDQKSFCCAVVFAASVHVMVLAQLIRTASSCFPEKQGKLVELHL